MLRQCLRMRLVSSRSYHDSRFQSKNKNNPIARVINKESKTVLNRRIDRDKELTATEQRGPLRTFEPFPFKITEDNRLETIKNIITPLHDIPYEQQLVSKNSNCKKGLRLLTQQLYNLGTSIRQDVNRLPCRVKPIVKSPLTENYRSSDEFSIWNGIDGKTPTVGYLAFPISRHGDSIALKPDGINIMKPITFELLSIVQQFIDTHRTLPICTALGTEGGWRRFSIKSNSSGESMLIGVASPRTIKVQQLVDEKEIFKQFMVEKTSQLGINLVSLYFQACPYNKCSHIQAPYELLHGVPYIKEIIGDLETMVFPESYVHPNTSALAVYHNEIINTIKECYEFGERKPLILDVNCRSGIMAINLACLASKVIGIDPCSGSIQDAINNCKLNQIRNCQFVCSSPEIILERLLEKHARDRDEIMVVANVTKKGLLPYVAEAIRNCELIKKVIYITPKLEHNNCQKDLIRLCKKQTGNTDATTPFMLIQATPVDLLPHCEGSDVIIALQRVE